MMRLVIFSLIFALIHLLLPNAIAEQGLTSAHRFMGLRLQSMRLDELRKAHALGQPRGADEQNSAGWYKPVEVLAVNLSLLRDPLEQYQLRRLSEFIESNPAPVGEDAARRELAILVDDIDVRSIAYNLDCFESDILKPLDIELKFAYEAEDGGGTHFSFTHSVAQRKHSLPQRNQQQQQSSEDADSFFDFTWSKSLSLLARMWLPSEEHFVNQGTIPIYSRQQVRYYVPVHLNSKQEYNKWEGATKLVEKIRQDRGFKVGVLGITHPQEEEKSHAARWNEVFNVCKSGDEKDTLFGCGNLHKFFKFHPTMSLERAVGVASQMAASVFNEVMNVPPGQTVMEVSLDKAEKLEVNAEGAYSVHYGDPQRRFPPANGNLGGGHYPAFQGLFLVDWQQLPLAEVKKLSVLRKDLVDLQPPTGYLSENHLPGRGTPGIPDAAGGQPEKAVNGAAASFNGDPSKKS